MANNKLHISTTDDIEDGIWKMNIDQQIHLNSWMKKKNVFDDNNKGKTDCTWKLSIVK